MVKLQLGETSEPRDLFHVCRSGVIGPLAVLPAVVGFSFCLGPSPLPAQQCTRLEKVWRRTVVASAMTRN